MPATLILGRRFAVVAILALAVGRTGQDEPHAALETGDDNAVVDVLFASRDLPGSPGCALAVAQDGALLYSRGYGYANLDYDIPVTPQTVFDVASVTKQFNAAGLSMLALEGKLSLDDDVRKWLPELPEYESPITLRQMLDHTSGLRDYLNLFPLAGRDDYFPISHAQILAMMSRQRALVSPPGDRYRYSNSAYMLLAQVLERAAGKSLGEMARERIFEPLGMEDSLMYESLEKIIPRRATGYYRDDDGRVRIVHNYNFDVAGDGQMYSTMEDLLRWDNYLHGAETPGADQQVARVTSVPPTLTSRQLAEFAGEFLSAELDATYRLAVVDGGLVVRIEQGLPLEVAPVAGDRFEFSFHPRGWSEPQPVSLEFERNAAGAVTGFGLSSGSERRLVFVKNLTLF